MAETTLGTCSHPDCNWIGQSVNWKKHKDGCGKEGKRRAGQHEGCMCCRFIPSIAPASETQLPSLQRTLQLLPAFDATTVHEHLRGEFHRRADIDGREYEAVFYPSVVRAFDTSCRQGFAKLVGENVLERHNRFENKQNVIIDAQVANFYAEASKRRNQLMTSHNRKLRVLLV